RTFGVVVDDDRHGHLVAARQGDGQVEIDEERLKDLDRGLRGAEPAVGGDGAGGQPPGGDGVGEGEGAAGLAVVVGDEFGVPEEGFREPVADADGRRTNILNVRACFRADYDVEHVGGNYATFEPFGQTAGIIDKDCTPDNIHS